jgi:ribosomal protein S18 acetylase RimI-like enzyme
VTGDRDQDGPDAPAVQARVDTSTSDEDARLLWPVYDSIFHDWPDLGSWRAAVWDTHRAREGFRLARAYDGPQLIGFAYGYTGRAGQWWTDNAERVLAPEIARTWLGGHFELVSLGVVAAARGAGVGRALLRHLTDRLPHERWLLMTTGEDSDPARRLYASEGWRVIGPGIGESDVIMGKANRPNSHYPGPGPHHVPATDEPRSRFPGRRN